MTQHDRVGISELIVLSLLREGPRSMSDLRSALIHLIQQQPDKAAFVLGPHASFRDFLLELYAAGAVRVSNEPQGLTVELTEHGRHEWLEKVPADVRRRYAFAFA